MSLLKPQKEPRYFFGASFFFFLGGRGVGGDGYTLHGLSTLTNN